MIEIQCTSCNTRYRIDERVLPEDSPSFKCSRCGHVFAADANVIRQQRKPAPEPKVPRAAKPDPPTPPPPKEEATYVRPKPRPPMMQVPKDILARQDVSRPAPAQSPKPPLQPPVEREAPEPPIEEEDKGEAAPATREEPPRADAPRTEPPPPRDNPLDRKLGIDREQPQQNQENLAFDFSDEEQEHQLEPEEPPKSEEPEWQVGEPELDEERRPTGPSAIDPASLARERIARAFGQESYEEPPPRRRPEPEVRREVRQTPPTRPPVRESGFPLDDEDVEVVAPRAVHGASWFLGLYFVIAIGFGALSLVPSLAPQACARLLASAPVIGPHFEQPILPATLVALHEVKVDYQQVKGGQTALVVSGTAQNVGNVPLRQVLIAVDLLDGTQHQIGSQSGWCGNNLSAIMVGKMTPREIQFLEGVDPQKSFELKPSGTTQFVLVFIDPPRNVTHLRVSVAKAAPAQAAPAEKG